MPSVETDLVDLRPTGQPKGVPFAAHGLAWGGTAIAAAILMIIELVLNDRNIWDGWPESIELQHPRYTEMVQVGQAFRTRANTWSNLAYVLTGLYAIALARKDHIQNSAKHGIRHGYVAQAPATSLFYGLACCYLGIGSGLFHASLTRWGQQLDVASMYAPLLVFIAMSVGRRWPHFRIRPESKPAPTWPIFLCLVFASSILLYQYKWSMASAQVLPTLILIMFASTILDRSSKSVRMQFRWLALSLFGMLIAVICRELDVNGRFSSPDSWWQGHALWHILTAASLACAYMYQRSETSNTQAPGLTP